MSILGWLEQVELGRIPAGGADFLIILISSTSSFVIYQSFLARTRCVAVLAHPYAVLHVGVHDLVLRVLPLSVLFQR